jgi:hypothetical protein
MRTSGPLNWVFVAEGLNEDKTNAMAESLCAFKGTVKSKEGGGKALADGGSWSVVCALGELDRRKGDMECRGKDEPEGWCECGLLEGAG